MVGMKWTAEADQKLLLLILTVTNNSAINYTAAAHMFTSGETVCTEEAVKQHIKNLKRQFNNDGEFSKAIKAANEGKAAAPSPSRPRKSKQEMDAKSSAKDVQTPSKKRKVASMASEMQNVQDDDESKDFVLFKDEPSDY